MVFIAGKRVKYLKSIHLILFVKDSQWDESVFVKLNHIVSPCIYLT